MKVITKNTDYAVRALVYLAGNRNRFSSSREIALGQKIPLQFLRRILQVLIKKGIIKAKEGVGGGVVLTKSPEKINLAFLMGVFQGRIEFSRCMFRRKICANRPGCPLRKKIKGIERKVIREFENITISDLSVSRDS